MIGREPVVLRPVVLWFAEHMEMQLRQHDKDMGKVGWQREGTEWLLKRLGSEYRELEDAVKGVIGEQLYGYRYYPPGPIAKQITEAVDVANFAMMVADVARLQEEDRLVAGDDTNGK